MKEIHFSSLHIPPVSACQKAREKKEWKFPSLLFCLIFSPSSSPCVTRQKPKGRSIPAKESEKKGKKKKKHHNNFEKSGANKALRGGEEGEEGLSYSDPVIRGSGRKSPPPFLPSFKFFDLEARGQLKKNCCKNTCAGEGLCWRREATFESFFCEVLFVAARVILFVGGRRSLPLVLSE